MNDHKSQWQKIGKGATTTVRKTICLPHLEKTERMEPYPVKGISKNYAFATIGFHKVAQRHLMSLSDICLQQAFIGTPELTKDERFCGTWDIVDLSTDAYPQLVTPNLAYRIRGKHMRDGKLKKPLRFTPLFTKNARKAVTLTKKKLRQQELDESSDEKSDLDSS